MTPTPKESVDAVLTRVRSAAKHWFVVHFDHDARLSDRDRALMTGIANNDVEAVRAALDARAFVGAPWYWKGRERGEAIHFAIHQAVRAGGDLRILGLLLAAGADAQAPDARGRTPAQFLDAVAKRYQDPALMSRLMATRAVLAGDRLAGWPELVTADTAVRQAVAPHQARATLSSRRP
jgi:hypothetical protein